MVSPLASAFVRKGRLCVIGVAETDYGPVPFSFSESVADAPEGPVDFGGDLAASVQTALDSIEKKTKAKVSKAQTRLAVESVVLRARQGDQNAMALLRQVAINAKRGIQRAKVSLKIATNFIKKNPIGTGPSFGVEVERMLRKARSPEAKSAVVVALVPYVSLPRLVNELFDGPPLRRHMRNIALALPKSERKAFDYGLRTGRNANALEQACDRLDPKYYRAFQVGFACKRALLMQNAFSPKGRLTDFDPVVGWELGE